MGHKLHHVGGTPTRALLKVNIMPPPMRMVSHLVSSDSSTGSLVETCRPNEG